MLNAIATRVTRVAKLSGAGRRLGLLTHGALDLLLPPECLTCDAPVQRPGLLCAACFRRTSFITEPCCAGCGVPFAYAGQGGTECLCPSCRTAPPAFGRAAHSWPPR
jgi:predicted amidophosphoribosyltransferase